MLTKEERWLLEEKYASRESESFAHDRARLSAGEPLAYIIGFVDFCGCRIGLLERPLIPRPETEYWTLAAIKDIQSTVHSDATIHCLDLFSGSGCVGIALAKHLPNAFVDFADINERCLAQIKENMEANGIGDERCKIFQSDVFSDIPNGKKYHLITANPPYINPAVRDTRVADSVHNFEPHSALFAGEEGFVYIRRVLAAAKNFLLPGGKLYLEYDDIQKNRIAGLLQEYGYLDFSFHQDQFGKWRFMKVCL
jgi:release factor glutamine methyltransferase